MKINNQRAQQYGEPLFWYGGSKDFLMSRMLDRDEDLLNRDTVQALLNTVQKPVPVLDQVDSEQLNDNNKTNGSTGHEKREGYEKSQSDKKSEKEVSDHISSDVRETNETRIVSLKTLCARVFKDVTFLKKKLNVKKYDKTQKTRPEFEGGSMKAETTKIECNGWTAIVHRPNDQATGRDVVEIGTQRKLNSWLHHRIRTFSCITTKMEDIQPEEPTTVLMEVPKLNNSGDKIEIWTRETTVDTTPWGLNANLNHEKITKITSKKGERMDTIMKTKEKGERGLEMNVTIYKKISTFVITEEYRFEKEDFKSLFDEEDELVEQKEDETDGEGKPSVEKLKEITIQETTTNFSPSTLGAAPGRMRRTASTASI